MQHNHLNPAGGKYDLVVSPLRYSASHTLRVLSGVRVTATLTKCGKRYGHATKTAAKDTEKGTDKAAHKTASVTKHVATKTGHATKVGAKDTAKDTEQGCR